ncbi:hypothetical protein A9Q84_13745 [Halobacteriovorax marinus]|uniref:Uncharacterized protein n=1 Tax=Halobacteriovorax marinus TaxID=97084 RepID=A0A1Y5F928_9BACT|nr:hypothetical protein A9Q84_13745 [Halobacteriovorax marinus]
MNQLRYKVGGSISFQLTKKKDEKGLILEVLAFGRLRVKTKRKELVILASDVYRYQGPSPIKKYKENVKAEQEQEELQDTKPTDYREGDQLEVFALWIPYEKNVMKIWISNHTQRELIDKLLFKKNELRGKLFESRNSLVKVKSPIRDLPKLKISPKEEHIELYSPELHLILVIAKRENLLRAYVPSLDSGHLILDQSRTWVALPER